MDDFPQSVNLIWRPRADGTFLEAPLQQLVLQGSVADIPFVTGKKNYLPIFSVVINLVHQEIAMTKGLCLAWAASTLRE